MFKYYIEFVIAKTGNTMDMQSKWFDTEEQAIEWLSKSFDYISMQIEAFLMKAEWDEEEDCMAENSDIIQVRRVI